MIDDVLFDMNETRIITYLQTKDDTNYVIPKTVQIIEWRAFSRNTNLQSLTIPASVHTINKNIRERKNKNCFLFSGLIRCPACNRIMVGSNNIKKNTIQTTTTIAVRVIIGKETVAIISI